MVQLAVFDKRQVSLLELKYVCLFDNGNPETRTMTVMSSFL
jgi:hypothetical protein